MNEAPPLKSLEDGGLSQEPSGEPSTDSAPLKFYSPAPEMQMGAPCTICTFATPRGRPVRSSATEWGHFLDCLVAIFPLMCISHLLVQRTHSFSSDHTVDFVCSHGRLPGASGGIARAWLALEIDAAPRRKQTSIVARVLIPWARDPIDGGGPRRLTVVISSAECRPFIASISRQLRQTAFELWRADPRRLAFESQVSARWSRRMLSLVKAVLSTGDLKSAPLPELHEFSGPGAQGEMLREF